MTTMDGPINLSKEKQGEHKTFGAAWNTVFSDVEEKGKGVETAQSRQDRCRLFGPGSLFFLAKFFNVSYII